MRNPDELKVVIVTEGFQAVGYGHLTRCLSLYQAFEERGTTPTYVARCDHVAEELLGRINLVSMEWLKDRSELLRIAKGSDIVVIDSYLADVLLYDELRNVTRRIVCFDDFLRLVYPAGVIVNGAVGAEKLPYTVDRDHQYLLGVDFIPLRREFWDVVVPPARQRIENVLVAFGGHDARSMTGKILGHLVRTFPELTYHVLQPIAQNGANDRTELAKVSYWGRIQTPDLLSLMLKCDAAVSAGGQTLNELARIGLPTVAVGVADNQRATMKGWVEEGFLQAALRWEDSDLISSLTDAFRRMSGANHDRRAFCDGQGARRIVSYLCEPCEPRASKG